MNINQPLVSLIIPCYNESRRLVHLERGLREFQQYWNFSFEVIVVDDGSSDETADLLRQLLPIFMNPELFQVIQLSENQGKGGALRAGVLAANGDFVLTLDADMAAHPLLLQDWLKILPNQKFSSDAIFIGSRNHHQSEIEAKSHRKFAGQLFNGLVQMITPIKIEDTQCGFKLYPTAIAKLLFQDLHIKGWAHDIELLYKARYLDISIESMPIKWKHVDDEKISVLSDGIKMAKETTFLSLRFRFHPTYRKMLKEMRRKFDETKRVRTL